jgi:hypothetical protein
MKNIKTFFAFFICPLSLSAWTGWNSGTILSLSKAHNAVWSPVLVKEFSAAAVLDAATISGATITSGAVQTSRKSFQMGAFSSMRYIKENSASTVAVSLGHKKSAFGLHYSYSGFSLYNEQQIGFSYGQSFGKDWNLGLGASYIAGSRVEGLQGDRMLDISLSVICRISSLWKVYSLAEIPVTLFSHFSAEGQVSPQRYFFKVGVGYNVLENLVAGIDITKDLYYPLQGAAGLSYLLAEHFSVYVSTEVYPFVHTVGVGYISKRWNIEWYGSYQTPFGFTASVGAGVKF